MPTDGGGNLITLAGRDGAIRSKLTGRAICARVRSGVRASLGTFIAAVTRTKPARMKGDRGMPADGEEPPRTRCAVPAFPEAVSP
jgi:hypothetical protein